MQSETLRTLVGKIRVQRVRLAHSTSPPSSAPWTLQEEIKLEELFATYGADFALLSTHFPARSRKQIRRKCQEIEDRVSRKQVRREARMAEERRKSYFDEAFLGVEVIRWPKKPNSSEEASSEDSL